MQLSDSDRLNFILDKLGLGPQAFSKKLQLPVHKIKSIKIGKVKISSEVALLIEEKFNFDFKWILTGIGKPYGSNITEEDWDSGKPNMAETQPVEMLQDFIDKQRALNINRELAKLERLDPESFKRIESYIKGTVDTVKEIAKSKSYQGTDRRKCQRRAKDLPDKIPGGEDRRSGLDRRKIYG